MDLTDVLAAAKVTGKAIGAIAVSLYTVGVGEVAIDQLRKSQKEIKDQIEKGEIKLVTKAPDIEIYDLGFLETTRDLTKKQALRTINIGRLGLHRTIESIIQEDQRDLLRRQNANFKQAIDALKDKE